MESNIGDRSLEIQEFMEDLVESSVLLSPSAPALVVDWLKRMLAAISRICVISASDKKSWISNTLGSTESTFKVRFREEDVGSLYGARSSLLSRLIISDWRSACSTGSDTKCVSWVSTEKVSPKELAGHIKYFGGSFLWYKASHSRLVAFRYSSLNRRFSHCSRYRSSSDAVNSADALSTDPYGSKG